MMYLFVALFLSILSIEASTSGRDASGHSKRNPYLFYHRNNSHPKRCILCDVKGTPIERLCFVFVV